MTLFKDWVIKIKQDTDKDTQLRHAENFVRKII